ALGAAGAALGAIENAFFGFVYCGLRAAQLLWHAAQPRVYILAVCFLAAAR
ncbi:hypothetical protein A2U01_0111879, partial [Trifolium medium]|nr:hypothetical protein [Trifolium medium]